MNPRPTLANIRLHPIKSLDAVAIAESRIGPGGGLELDRVWALYSADGEGMVGKNTPAIHLIRAAFAPDLSSVTLSAPDVHPPITPGTFAFPRDHALAAEWFTSFFAQPVEVRHVPEGVPDDLDRNGPMILSTATLQTVAAWFPALDLAESRRRFRAPLEIGDVEAFWEDRLFNVHETEPVPFRIGDVMFDGINPCPRCAVPSRDSATGAEMTGFQKQFTELRRASYPSWARHPDRVRHFYTLGINTTVARSEVGKVLRVGDEVRML